jgi:ribosomal protein L13
MLDFTAIAGFGLIAVFDIAWAMSMRYDDHLINKAVKGMLPVHPMPPLWLSHCHIVRTVDEEYGGRFSRRPKHDRSLPGA